MKNVWTTKNPLMSMWLSGANAMIGKAYGHAMAESRRQTSAAMSQAAREMIRFWMGGATRPTRRKKKSR
jgi:hypothetical protein